MDMNVTAKIFFNNTTTYIENDFLKIKKMIIIKDLLLLPNVKNPKHLLNKYKFEDKSVDKIYKKYTMKHEEWLELLNGVDVSDVFKNVREFNRLNYDEKLKNYKDYYNYFNETSINTIDYVLIEIFE